MKKFCSGLEDRTVVSWVVKSESAYKIEENQKVHADEWPADLHRPRDIVKFSSAANVRMLMENKYVPLVFLTSEITRLVLVNYAPCKERK